MYECTENRFLGDVKDHELTVVRDDGVNRHLRFKRPGTGCYHFDLITWPGHLCITGDCGTYVFQRVEDMFKFFRMTESDLSRNPEKKLNINTGYWAEKVLSVDKHGKIKEFSSDTFREDVKQYFDDFFEDCDETDKNEIWNEIEESVLSYADDEHEAYRALYDFHCKGFEFAYFESSCKEYTFRYIWNLYAIVYGILEYDKL